MSGLGVISGSKRILREATLMWVPAGMWMPEERVVGVRATRLKDTGSSISSIELGSEDREGGWTNKA